MNPVLTLIMQKQVPKKPSVVLCALWYSVLCGTLCSAVLCALRYSVLCGTLCSAVLCGTLWYSVLCGTLWYTFCSTLQQAQGVRNVREPWKADYRLFTETPRSVGATRISRF